MPPINFQAKYLKVLPMYPSSTATPEIIPEPAVIPEPIIEPTPEITPEVIAPLIENSESVPIPVSY
jgi:hypothetical protein